MPDARSGAVSAPSLRARRLLVVDGTPIQRTVHAALRRWQHVGNAQKGAPRADRIGVPAPLLERRHPRSFVARLRLQEPERSRPSSSGRGPLSSFPRRLSEILPMPAEEADGRLRPWTKEALSRYARGGSRKRGRVHQAFRDWCLASDAIMTAIAIAALLRMLPARRPLSEAT
jgi:hypothetical protein